MKKEEILDYNKRCAEFLNRKYQDNRITLKYTHFSNQNPTGEVWEECKYHSDWNWIMEVVDKIEKLEIKTSITCDYACIMSVEGQVGLTVGSYKGKSKKEAVVQVINQFLIWYNEKQ